jgi:hypothetical protein
MMGKRYFSKLLIVASLGLSACAAEVGSENADSQSKQSKLTSCQKEEVCLHGLVQADDFLLEDAFIEYGNLFAGQQWGYLKYVKNAAEENLRKAPEGSKYAGQYYYDEESVEIGLCALAVLESSVHVVFKNSEEGMTVTVIGPRGKREGIFSAYDMKSNRDLVFGYVMAWVLHVGPECAQSATKSVSKLARYTFAKMHIGWAFAKQQASYHGEPLLGIRFAIEFCWETNPYLFFT